MERGPNTQVECTWTLLSWHVRRRHAFAWPPICPNHCVPSLLPFLAKAGPLQPAEATCSFNRSRLSTPCEVRLPQRMPSRQEEDAGKERVHQATACIVTVACRGKIARDQPAAWFISIVFSICAIEPFCHATGHGVGLAAFQTRAVGIPEIGPVDLCPAQQRHTCVGRHLCVVLPHAHARHRGVGARHGSLTVVLKVFLQEAERTLVLRDARHGAPARRHGHQEGQNIRGHPSDLATPARAARKTRARCGAPRSHAERRIG